jgi:hypothetical protein
MRHALPRLWLAAGLFVALANGCEHVEPIDSQSDLIAPITVPPDDLPGGQTPPSYAVRLSSDGSAAPGPIPPARRTIRQARHDRRRVKECDRIVAAVQWDEQPTEAATFETPLSAGAGRVGSESQWAGFGHAGDYRWLVGRLLRDPERGSWSVVYAQGGDQDLYGGRLELVNTGPMDDFEPGRLVRVEGDLVDPAPLEIKPAYRLRSIQVLRP